MSAESLLKNEAQATTAEDQGLLSKVVAATRQTEPDRAQNLLRTLTDQALKGTVKYDRNLTVTLNQAIAKLDRTISEQLAAIMQAPEFAKRGTWRGLNYLVKNSETSVNLKIRVMNAGKRELARDLEKAVEFDQSRLFKAIYEDEFGTPGGEPLGAIIGDYEFDNSFDDVQLLQGVSSIAAAAFAPFISAASPHMFGFEDYRDLARPRDLEKIFDTVEYAKWRSFRESDDSRFVTLALPRVLARMPYGPKTNPIDDFAYDETKGAVNGDLEHDEYCWMNAAYVMGTKLTDAFAKAAGVRLSEGLKTAARWKTCPCMSSPAMTATWI